MDTQHPFLSAVFHVEVVFYILSHTLHTTTKDVIQVQKDSWCTMYIPTPNQELKGSTSCIYLETDLSNVFGLKSITTLAADGKNTL